MLIDFLRVNDRVYAAEYSAEGMANDQPTFELAAASQDWLMASAHIRESGPLWISGLDEGLDGSAQKTLLDAAGCIFRRLQQVDGKKDRARMQVWIERLVTHHQGNLKKWLDEAETTDQHRHNWHVVMDLGLTLVRILFGENVLSLGFRSLDKHDLKMLLEKYHAHPKALSSAFLKMVYDSLFAFEQGDPLRPRLAAGAAIRTVLSMFLNYKGSVLWKLNAGVGDAIFTPYYKLLKHRGVKFRFFHRVTALRGAGGNINSIDIARQMRLKKGIADYDPLCRVGDLDCWPDRPRYEQLRKGRKLERRADNLESFWCRWQFSGYEKARTLRRGRDFDAVILGIGPGAFQHLCKDLNSNRKWRRMVRSTATVQTQTMQLWPLLDLKELGWVHGPVQAGFETTGYSTWVDMSHRLAEESWDLPKPESSASFCGVLEDAPAIPDADGWKFPRLQDDRVSACATHWLRTNVSHIWPEAFDPDGEFREFILKTQHDVDVPGLSQQYFRANIDPSDRCVLSLPGSVRHRLSAGESGFNNLFLAGDWVNNEFNVGCVEAATLAGLAAARAVEQADLKQ